MTEGTDHFVHCAKPEIPLDPIDALHETPRDVHEYLNVGIVGLDIFAPKTTGNITEILDRVLCKESVFRFLILLAGARSTTR